ncbi:MAG: glycosyltransferase family 2 protein [Rikenellaceae bacterium]|nr:glycosyltransferase family 2 protein [Rikenellaceae bacterium]MCL2692560.1 glycosyltransferase family 2 protein [Rikenellaceae bacterium]
MDISVVIPLYNEEESLRELAQWIARVMDEEKLTYEVIFIDDGSSDRSWEVVSALAREYPAGQMRGIRFMRNYGKSAALYHGFEAAQGEVVITMDADLQDSPDEIPRLYRMVTEGGYDLVSGWKKDRKDPAGKRLPSKLFNATARAVSGIKLHDFNCGLKAYRKRTVKSIEVYGEMHRYIPILAKNAGFRRIGELEVTHYARKHGRSKFGWERTIKGYLDLITVSFMTRFGKSPMYFFGTLGTLMFLLGGATTVWLIVEKIVRQSRGLEIRGVTDQPLFYIALLAVVLGVMLFLAGFLGELISRNSPVRNRYLIDETTHACDSQPAGRQFLRTDPENSQKENQ